MKKLEVVPHDPGWREAFEAESHCVARVLGRNVVAIYHIGSTSIPDIYAKPVIDILVAVEEIAGVDLRDDDMVQLGYEVMGEFGIPGRRYFRKDNDAGVRTHQIHVFESGSDQVARHLAFRDYMISHPADAQAYSDLKRRLASQFPDDPDCYMDGKGGFIKEMDQRATEWLEALDSTPGHSVQ